MERKPTITHSTKKAKTVKATSKPANTKQAKVQIPKKEAGKLPDELQSGLTLPVFDTQGNKKGKVTLPGEIFGVKVNAQLLAQAFRVYQANQRAGAASTKTRGEVEGSTRKIYRQKGTGKARHGGIRAPIFVGGGIAFGPKPRSYHLEFPKAMKARALASALTMQLQDGKIVIVDGLAALPPKTKGVYEALTAIGASHSTLLVTTKDAFALSRGARNIEGVTVMPVENLHTFAVLSHQHIVFTKETLPILKGRFG